MLVGTKSDLRSGNDQLSNVSRVRAEEMAESIEAAGYVECSALTRQGLDEVFEEAIRAAMESRVTKKNKKNKVRCELL